MKRNQTNWERLPDKISLYLLDVHHSVAILELLRILIDEYYLTFQQAFILSTRCFSLQSQGTVEELAMRWNVDIFKKILPRHLELIVMIDYFFVQKLR